MFAVQVSSDEFSLNLGRYIRTMDPSKHSNPRDIPTIRTNHASSIVEEEKPNKYASAFDLPLPSSHRDELLLEDIHSRRRSHSAPLSLEASGVAARLRKASDSLHFSYEKGNKLKKRRVTVTGYNLQAKRRSWPAWNPMINENEETTAFPYSSSVPSNGTSV